MTLSTLDWSILGPATLAGLIVLATHVPLGREVLRRGIIFIDLAVAQIAPTTLRRWSPWLYTLGVLMLIAVLAFGEVGKGAQRWLDLGVIRFQPSEMVKLAVPLMILAETSLSFLGIGLQPSIVSWGTLLKEAQNIRTIIEAPWLLIAPGTVIVITVLALNFLGDGLRDAADPYGR